MTDHYTAALQEAESVESGKWKIGYHLMLSVDNEGRSIREFAMERDKNFDKEDTYGNYIRANRMREFTRHYPGIERLKVLPISYWYEGWKIIEGVEPDDEDTIEDVLNKMASCAYDEKGNLRKRFLGVRRVQAMRKKDKTIEEMEAVIAKKLKEYEPMITGRKEALSVSEARGAWRKAKLVKLLLREVEIVK